MPRGKVCLSSSVSCANIDVFTGCTAVGWLDTLHAVDGPKVQTRMVMVKACVVFRGEHC